MPVIPTFVWIIILLLLAGVGFLVGIQYRKRVAEREIGSAEDEAKRIINEAIKSAESKKREALVEAKEEIHKNRSEFEREEKLRRAEVQKQERRLQQKEEALDRKTDALEKKNDTLSQKISAVEAQQAEVQLIKNNARLYSSPTFFLVDFQNFLEMLADVNNDTVTYYLSGNGSAASPRDEMGFPFTSRFY